MPITILCPGCSTRLTVGADRAGERIECPRCDRSIDLPPSAPTATGHETPPRAHPRTTSPPVPPRPVSVPPPLPQISSLPPRELDEPQPSRPVPPPLPVPLEAKNSSRTLPGEFWSRKRALAAAGIGAALLLVVGTVFAIRATRSKPEEAQTAQRLSGEQIYRQTVRSTVFIAHRKGTGSGFLVNAEKKLIVTNYHVVGATKNVNVYFPYYDEQGQLVTDLNEYETRVDSLRINGEVLVADTKCDLALLRLDRLPDKVSALKLAKQPAPTGSVVYSVGGSGFGENLLWRLSKGSVRGRGKRQTQLSFGMLDCMILETDAPINRGDSGGPVVNEYGEVVAAVDNFALKERLVSGNIDVEELQKFLSRHVK
jgi:Trypsin-like peptidase domain